MTIFFILTVILTCVLLMNCLLKFNLYYIPESLTAVFLGVAIGFALSYAGPEFHQKIDESFPANTFFLILLPPIIFDSGYNLQKKTFFRNIVPILTFALFGTVISTFAIGAGLYGLGQADVIHNLTLIDSLALGSTISAIDPVATLAIFQSLDVDPVLFMLVFGESVLNDAVALILTRTITSLNSARLARWSLGAKIGFSISWFLVTLIVSGFIGVAFALVCSMLLKHVDLARNPTLELCLMTIFALSPYLLAEGLELSGITAELAAGMFMSHYAHYSISPPTQVSIQLVFRSLAFISEMSIFVFLGMAIFNADLRFSPAFIAAIMFTALAARALHVFPLSAILNRFRKHERIDGKKQFIIWFSGLRGAIAFAVALHMPLQNEQSRSLLVSATLIFVILTIILFGGATTPLLKVLYKPQTGQEQTLKGSGSSQERRRCSADWLIPPQLNVNTTPDLALVQEPEEEQEPFASPESLTFCARLERLDFELLQPSLIRRNLPGDRQQLRAEFLNHVITDKRPITTEEIVGKTSS